MGKRKKIQPKLSNEELVPSTLGYFEENKRGLFGLVLIFIIFICVAVFMPQITDYVNKFLGKTDDEIIEPDSNVNNSNDDNLNSGEKIVMYDISDTLEFEYNKIKFSSFRINLEYLNFNVQNTTDELLDFGTTKYYIETYSSDGTLLERHIFNSIKVNPSSTMTQNIVLLENEIDKVSKIEISNKNEKDYPDVTLQANSNNEYTLVCNNEVNTLTYTYDKDNKLLKITDVINYKNDKSTKYSSNLTLYQNKVATLNNKEGISSSLVEISTGFTVTTDIDLSKANTKELSNNNYYDNKTLPKVVKFEMESRGFSCK